MLTVKKGFILRKLDTEHIVVAIGEASKEFNGMIRLNGTGAMYWKELEKGTTKEELVAKTMEQAAKLRAHGLFNTVPDETINKYELLQLFNMYIRREPIEINPMDKFVADKSLVRTRYDGFNYRIPDYKTMIMELGEWMREHREMYPHYDI